ncbi:hypothetical protein [Arenibacter nanhaiticus]|nr:hypothetical protein [Arenibacter nanhaiticus]
MKAQIPSNVYYYTEKTNGKIIQHELKIDSSYFVHTSYQTSPSKFMGTRGGYYRLEKDHLKVQFEFNSNYQKDSLTSLVLPYTLQKGGLTLLGSSPKKFRPLPYAPQALEGKWLMAGRVTEEGENRWDNTGPRKTMKFLLNGHFQWIAFHTGTMAFLGSGGGTYTAKDGLYTENIGFFSRDNSKAGAVLSFQYEVIANEWYHSGKSSKGDPLHEIWAKRPLK